MSKASLVLAIVFSVLLFGTAGAQTAHAVSAHAKPAEAILGYHVVQPGETVYCIARAYRVDPWAIAYENGLVNPDLIYPGMTLSIPDAPAWLPPGATCAAQFGPPPPCHCVTYHTVLPGETLFRISLTYGVSMWRIAECNSIYDLDHIAAYSSLCIPTP